MIKPGRASGWNSGANAETTLREATGGLAWKTRRNFVRNLARGIAWPRALTRLQVRSSSGDYFFAGAAGAESLPRNLAGFFRNFASQGLQQNLMICPS